ncbi:STAS domain-containing protein [Chitinibacter sp. FCG-7]|uniref:STAS domain-containing protein n=1 Tax=Chitinibacter mangrovi TaxID=3153927 RepID=A0AAU7FCD0_9NEIS
MSAIYHAPALLSSEHCGQLLGAIDDLLRQGDVEIDFSALSSADSSAVALLLEWQRRAQAAKRALRFAAMPSTLQQLISVYGVQELLQIKN